MSRYSVSLKYGSFLMAFLLLVGCANIGKVEFDKAANTKIKKIALLRVDEPRNFWLAVPTSKLKPIGTLGKVLVLGGIVGSLVWAGVDSKIDKMHSDEFRQALNDHHIQFGPTMVEALRQELTKKGYDFIYLKDQSLMIGGDEKDNYLSHIQTDADAILFVHIGAVGYSARGKTKDFKPEVNVSTSLFDSRSKRKILWLFRIFAEQDYLPDGFSGRANRGHHTHKLYVTQIDILYNPLRKLV
jgi:hypothetical protein